MNASKISAFAKLTLCISVVLCILLFVQAQSATNLWLDMDGNEGRRIRIHVPDSFTNRLEIYRCTDIIARNWNIAAEDLQDGNTNVIHWMETNETALSYYVAGNADLDKDGDALADAREIFVHKTAPDNPDTDGDLLKDGWECANGLDPHSGSGEEGSCGDPDGDGFINAEECENQTDPFIADAVPSTLPYATGFESADGFSAGPLDGQQGWMAEGAAGIAQNNARSGNQLLKTEGGTIRHNFTGMASSYSVEFWLYLSGQSIFPPAENDYPLLASTIIGFDPQQGVMALDGDGNGGGNWIAAPDSRFIDTWVKIRIEQDYASAVWNLWLNDDLKFMGLGFRNDIMNRLHGVTVKGDGLLTQMDDMEVIAY